MSKPPLPPTHTWQLTHGCIQMHTGVWWVKLVAPTTALQEEECHPKVHQWHFTQDRPKVVHPSPPLLLPLTHKCNNQPIGAISGPDRLGPQVQWKHSETRRRLPTPPLPPLLHTHPTPTPLCLSPTTAPSQNHISSASKEGLKADERRVVGGR